MLSSLKFFGWICLSNFLTRSVFLFLILIIVGTQGRKEVGMQKSEQFVHISSKNNIASALAIVQFIKQLKQFLYPVAHKDPENKFHQEY